MTKLILAFYLCLPLFSFARYKLKPIVYSSKQDVTNENMIEDFRVISKDDSEMISAHQLEDVVRTLPGVVTSHNGGIGGKSSVFVRGSESRHTLILIDGVRYHDPTSPDRTINLSVLKDLDIERIEFLRGSQGVLYGSDAIGGVINIITKKGDGKSSVRLTKGYYDQYNVQNTFVLGANIFSFSAHYFDSDALSAAKDGVEQDQNINKGVTLKHSFDKEGLKSETTIKYVDVHLDTDRLEQPSQTPADDTGTFSKDTQLFINQKLEMEIVEQRSLYLDIALSQYDRKEKYYNSDFLRYDRMLYEGDTVATEIKLKEQFLDGSLIYGIGHSIDSAKNSDDFDEKQSLLDLFVNHHQQYWGYNFSYGARLTRNNDFGDHLVYKLGLERDLIYKRLKVGAMLGTGFKAPSIAQQFTPSFGNAELAPEKSLDWELFSEFDYGPYEQRLTYFHSEIDDLIGFLNSSYENTGALLSKGVEFGQRFSFKSFYVSLDMTLQSLENEDGTKVLRRPEKTYDLSYGHNFNDLHSLQVLFKWVGERYDRQVSEDIFLGEYATTDLSYRFMKKNVSIITSVRNLFDTKYELVKGYSTLGRNMAVNLKISY